MTSKTTPLIATSVGFESSLPVWNTCDQPKDSFRSNRPTGKRSEMEGTSQGGHRGISVVPSHLASSAAVIGSSLGGLRVGGFLGAKFLGSATCPADAIVVRVVVVLRDL